jgi:peptide/nickel transport system substrate-binding protein
MHQDPKSFNLLVAEQDATTSGVVSGMVTALFDYDQVSRAWVPHGASFEIRVFEEENRLDVLCTLRDDLYWTWYDQDRRVKVTSDDIIFWYNEIHGDPACESSGYYQQFVTMEDGTEAHVDIEKIDDRRFVLHYPRIVAEPLLASNMSIMPKMDYEEAKRQGGAEAVRGIFGVNTDPRRIPSTGEWYLVAYDASHRLVYRRNPHYWEKDSAGVSLPYVEEKIIRIVADETTQFFMFKQNETDAYAARPEDLDELVNRRNPHYTVYNAEGSQSAPFWTFNQNPVNRDRMQYAWFIQKEFRQAMSCLLNRERIIMQVYRGLAEPKLSFFPETNPYYDSAISLEYTYHPERAAELLSSIGMRRGGDGVMRDSRGRAVEFNLTITSDSTIFGDIASIIADELGKAGITVHVRVLEFQKMVEQLTETFDWESLLIGLSGSNTFPSQGSNVWVSKGNLHMWHPNQAAPATGWEARVDWLYNEGAYTVDPVPAKIIWDEYQRILLEQCPVIYLVRARSFAAVSHRWDHANVYYDNRNGLDVSRVFLAP